MKQSLAAATTEEKIESEMVSLFDRRQNEGLFQIDFQEIAFLQNICT